MRLRLPPNLSDPPKHTAWSLAPTEGQGKAPDDRPLRRLLHLLFAGPDRTSHAKPHPFSLLKLRSHNIESSTIAPSDIMVARQASWSLSTTTTLPDSAERPKASPHQDRKEDSHDRADTQTAIDSWLSAAEELDPGRRSAFLEGADISSFEDYALNLTRAVENTSNVSKVSRLSQRMKPIYQLSNSIAPILSSASQASPMPAALVLGGITCVLSLTVRLEDFETKVIETLEWMCDEMDLLKEYKHGSRLDDDPAVKAYEVKLATDILRFCVGVDKLYYRGGRKTRGSIRFMFKTIYKNFEDRFGDVKNDFQRHRSALEKRRELVNRRILEDMNTKVSDMGNQLRESGDKDLLLEREARNRKEGEFYPLLGVPQRGFTNCLKRKDAGGF